jgi:hypothetical protein
MKRSSRAPILLTVLRQLPLQATEQWFLTCGPRNPGDPRLYNKLNNLFQKINKVQKCKKAKSEIKNFKTLCKSEEI